MTPTIGRIVHYCLTEQDVAHIDNCEARECGQYKR